MTTPQTPTPTNADQVATGALPRYAVTVFKPSGINPRTLFNEAKLLELGRTMLEAQGPVQPVVAYIDDDGQLAIIAGERRWRAAVLVGITDLETIVRAKLAGKDARKAALLENMQREELTPLEIAWGVRAQLAETNDFGVPLYTKTGLAEELGQPPEFITWCESLLRCPESVQQMVHRKEVKLRLAALVGSLPLAMHAMAISDMITRPGGPMPIEDAVHHVAKYRRDLRKASFDQKIVGLIEGAPACAACEFCGANRTDVAGKHKASVCLNVSCYDGKQEAAVKLARSSADDGHGVPFIGNEKREEVFSDDGVTVKGDSGYVAADEPPDGIMVVNPKAQLPAWGTIIEASGADAGARKIIDGEGNVRLLYDAKLALQAATADTSAHKEIFKHNATVTGAKSGTVEDEAKEAAKNKARDQGRILAAQSFVNKLGENDRGEVWGEVDRLLFERLTEDVDRKWLAKVLGADPAEVITKGRAREVLALALVARTLRLQGPGSVEGITGGLCKMIGYKPAQEAKAIESAVAAAAAGKEKKAKAPAKKKAGKDMPPGSIVVADPEHPDAPAPPALPGMPPEPQAAPAKQLGGKREKDEESEKKAWAAYFETGSIADAAAACGLSVGTVKNWFTRRKWKAKREAELAAQAK